MRDTIETFYLLDYDRCLGDYEANFELAKKIVDETTNVSGEEFHAAHDSIKVGGVSFRILEYLAEKDPDFIQGSFMNEYIRRAGLKPGCLLEPGAVQFIDSLRVSGHHFCIMSFGDKDWQRTKITGAGLGDMVRLIVSTEHKGRYIGEWFDEETSHFIVPGECFSDGESRKAKEVVLIDDKLKAFDGFHPKARGYLLQSVARIYISPQGKVPKNVKRVTRLDEIIEHESMIVKKTTNQS